MKINSVCHTAGTGLWSSHSRAVRLIELELGYVNADAEFGELRVYFDEDTWSVHDHGLIYTDSRFISELRAVLADLGISGSVEYSEQGMQGEDYVSLDCDGAVISSMTQPA